MIAELADLGFVLTSATRQTQLLTKGATDGVPVSVVYLIVFPCGEEPEQLVVTKKVQFG